MKDFRLFDIYDFLMDEDFIRWVRKGQREDDEFWRNWLTQNPDKHFMIVEASRILKSIGPEQKAISDSEKNGEIEKLMLAIKELDHGQPDRPAGYKIKRFPRWYAIAALFILAAAAGIITLLVISRQRPVPTYAYAVAVPSKKLIEKTNTSGAAINFTLPDGSVVTLAPDSRVAYASTFDSVETRDVYLLGEAFFNVHKNPSRPFRVFANEIVTKVLGTSFRIRCFEKDSAIKVTVSTGRVSVYPQAGVSAKETALPNSLGGIILTPNQEVVYQKRLQKFQRILLDNPVMVLPVEADRTLFYDDASLIKVFSQLDSNYGINIVYDNEALKNCTITADLRNVSFYEKLDLMCKAIGAKYEVIDGQVVIQAKGCE